MQGSLQAFASGGNHDLALMYSKGLSLHSVLMLIPLITGIGRDQYRKILFEIRKLVELGEIKPLIHKEIFNWKQVSLAHRLVESKQQKGKVVLVIE